MRFYNYLLTGDVLFIASLTVFTSRDVFLFLNIAKHFIRRVKIAHQIKDKFADHFDIVIFFL